MGASYSQTLTANGGTAPYTFAVTAGSVPAGLTLSTAGVLSGTPTTAGSSSFTVTATDSDGVTGSQAYTLAVSAPAASFSVSGFPSPTTAGVAGAVTVTALNSNGTTDTGYLGTVQLTSSDPQAVLPANCTFTAADQGVHTFTVTLKTAGNQSITATDTATGAVTGSETGITVTPAAAAALDFSNTPSGATACSAFTLTVTAKDAYGNTAAGYSGTVQITSSDPQAVLPGNFTITGGTGTFNVTLETAGTQSVTATDVNNPQHHRQRYRHRRQLRQRPARSSSRKNPPAAPRDKPSARSRRLIEDAYGNVETGDNSDKVTLSVNSGPSTQLGGTLTETVAAGIAIFSNLLLDTSGSYTLAALANLAGGGTLGPVVSSSFTVASPVSLSFGSITYNSKTKLYSETVTLTNTTSGTLTGPMSLELTNLPSGVVLTDATGTTNGNPYYRFLTSGKTLKKGASVSITLTFTAASLSDITFGTEVVVGLSRRIKRL